DYYCCSYRTGNSWLF
nr:immunoglobulin light chain junction region [Macaca mulatta]MOV66236.1 immunoglobulin light chain junction region [Macaca mulatta]MOV66452.1 immunoglobulin light chain junction region [Macaca mulatta]MOV66929.1 immunoglobulin light chain junction region [Macaca mulatta]MOV69310.1 immunoglobulin light chain junction region [Macaca mulatta]